MLTERPWKQDAVLQLLLRIFICFGVVILATGLLLPNMTSTTSGNLSFYHFLASTLAVQGMAILFVHIFLREHEWDWRRFLGLDVMPFRRVFIYAVGGVIFFLPVALTLSKLSAMGIESLLHTEPDAQPSVRVLRATHGLAQNIYFGITTILIAPFIEETMFRGILYPTVKQAGYPRLALIGTSVVFGAIHANLMTLVPLTVLAMMLAWLYERTDSLLTPIFAHGLFNAANFILLLNENHIERLLKSLSERI